MLSSFTYNVGSNYRERSFVAIDPTQELAGRPQKN